MNVAVLPAWKAFPDSAIKIAAVPLVILLGGFHPQRAIGDALFGPNSDFFAYSPFSVAIGDLNGDGKPDVAVANIDYGTASVLLGNGDGTFGPPTHYLTEHTHLRGDRGL